MATSTAGGAMSIANTSDWTGRRILIVGSCGDLDIALTEALGRMSAEVHVERPSQSQSVSDGPLVGDRYEDVLALTQAAVRSLGGLDGVVTLVELDRAALLQTVATDRIERFCEETLAGTLAAIRVALNRMGTTWVEGALTTVLVVPAGLPAGAALVAQIARSTLVDMIRHEAVRVAPFGICVRAVIVDQSVSDDAEAAIAAILTSISLSTAAPSGVALEVEG